MREVLEKLSKPSPESESETGSVMTSPSHGEVRAFESPRAHPDSPIKTLHDFDSLNACLDLHSSRHPISSPRIRSLHRCIGWRDQKSESASAMPRGFCICSPWAAPGRRKPWMLGNQSSISRCVSPKRAQSAILSLP